MANSTKISEYSTTAANNTSIDSIDIDENCAASGINNAIRSVLKHQADAFTQGTPIALDQTNNRVGIGTSSPSTKIHLNESGSANAVQRIQAGTNNYAAQLHLYGNNVSGAAYNSVASYVNGDGTAQWEITGPEASSEDQMLLHTGGSERMRINSSGHVKINNSRTTSVPFHVVGGTASGTTYDTAVFAGGQNSTSGSGAKIYLSGCENDPISRGTFISGIAVDNGNSHALTFATSGNSQAPAERMRIDNNGKVYIGRSTDPYMSTGSVHRLSVDGGTSSTQSTFVSNKNSASTMFHFYFHNSNSVVGSISTNAHATSFNTSSDHRLKENVSDITGAIARVKSLQPKRFNWITEPDTTIDGFLAHEAAAVVPESVTGSHNETRAAIGIVKAAGGKVLAESVEQADWTANKGDDEGDLYPSDSTWTASEDLPVYQTIDQAKLVPVLTAALKEAITKIETLETEMTALKARVTALEA